ncbi:MAG: hypothetical protein NT137_00130 [Methanomassiliicoccales archaeon]|nr:hypothetical protein [Methanomassiliicoccales archaeon]
MGMIAKGDYLANPTEDVDARLQRAREGFNAALAKLVQQQRKEIEEKGEALRSEMAQRRGEIQRELERKMAKQFEEWTSQMESLLK